MNTNLEQLKRSTKLKRITRTLLLAAMLLLGGMTAKAADYVFIYDNGYLAVDNSGNIVYTNTFSPQCVWTCVSNSTNLTAAELQNSNTLYWLTTLDANGTRRWMQSSNSDGSAITTSTTAGTNYWRRDNNSHLIYRRSNTSYYVYYRDNTWKVSSTAGSRWNYGSDRYSGYNGSPDYRSTTYSVTTTPNNLQDFTWPTITPDHCFENTIYLNRSDLTGTYTPAYTRYQFNGTNHYWYDDSDHNSAPSTINASDLNPTYTWSITNGGNFASIDPVTGQLTITGTPTENIRVLLTVNNISPLEAKYIPYLITYNSVAATSTQSTEISEVSISPSTTSLDVSQSQVFTASGTATTTNTEIPAHVTLLCPNGSGNTQYYYYGGTLFISTDPFSTPYITHPNLNYAWSLSSEATGYMTYVPTSGATTTVTYNTQAPTAIIATLTVTASYNSITEIATAIVKGYAPLVAPTITSSGSRVTLSTTSLDAEIWYTVDDGDPTDPNNPNRIQYNGPFTVSGSPVTVKAATYRNGYYSTITSETITLKLTPPVISFSPNSPQGATATTTLIGHTDGNTIYYTTDGSTPTTSSPTYSAPFNVPSGTTVKAFAAKTGWVSSNVVEDTYTATQLETPYIEISVLGVRFYSGDEDVTFYYTTDGSNPTTSSSSWQTGDNPISGLADNTTIKVMAVKDGYLNSEVATKTYEVLTHYVFMYNDNGVYHFLGNDDGTPTDYLYFDSRQIVWEGDPVSTGTNAWQVNPSNNGWYMHLCTESGNDANLHFDETSNHILNIEKDDDNPVGTVIYYHLNNFTSYVLHYHNNRWSSASETYNMTEAKVVHQVVGEEGDDYAVRVASLTPSVNHGGLNVLYPPTSGNPADAETMTIVGEIVGTNYLPDYFTVGFDYNPVGYFIEGGNTLLSERPTASTQFNYSYEFVDDISEWCSLEGNVVRYIKDPGHNMEVLVRVIASPVGYGDVTREAIASFTIISDPPLATPVITRVGQTNLYEMTTTAANSVIEYNLDGGPWFTYYSPIEVTTPGVVITARTYRASDNQTSSEVSLVTIGSLQAPVITADNSGTVTITNPNSFAPTSVIYYTTDGTSPDASSTLYTAPFEASNETTVKAIVVANNYIDSPIAVSFIIFSGVSTTTVTLNDLEDHTWTYYSGVDASVDGGNYNTNYLGKIYSPNPRNVKITYNGVNGITGSEITVRVSTDAGETQNQFVYYKTLEQGNTSGEYPYQVISNPFSVRPSTGTGNNKVYYGFAGWKIVSGGEYIKNHSNTDVLSLDEEIVFNNLPYSEVNCTSAEIVFETAWTQANVRTGDNISTMMNNLSSTGTYETNFAVLTGNYTTAWTGNKNVTVTSVLPDGSVDYRDQAYTYLNLTLNTGYTVKYEYVHINNNSTTFSMGTGTKTLYIGRGVSNTAANGVCCNLIQGYDASIANGGLTYTLKLESGVYNYLSFIKGYDGSSTTNTVTGTVSVKSVLGCDYDRAKNDNAKLKIQQQNVMGWANGNNYVLLQSATAGQEVLNVTMKSGSLNSNLTSAGTADASDCLYLGIAGGYSAGYRIFTMEGGEMWSLAAGICNNTATTNSIRFRIKGGLIKGSIYGSAANANSYGYKQMILTGGQVKGWIAGGGNGTSANGGTTTGSSYVYVGGNCRVDSEGSTTNINSSLGGQVFGSGSGVANTTTWGEMLYGTNVVIADNAYIERDVYGGGNFGWTDQTATIYLTGENMSVGKVFGGANQNNGEYVNVYMTGGTVRDGLYGGSNTTGTIAYDVTMHINGGQVGVDNNNRGNIHGGGFGSPTRVTGNVELTLGTTTQTTPGVTVYGDVYGGSALGWVNGISSTTTAHTYVTMNKGYINGSLYGGGLGDDSNPARVYGPVEVTVNGGSIKTTDGTGNNGSGAVFGCNNVNGAPQQTVTVDIYGTDYPTALEPFALFAVYGGGNHANYAGKPIVTVYGCENSINYVYGGANAAEVIGTDVTIWGGHIGYVFGGGNGTVTPADVTGTDGTTVRIKGGNIENIFGGSNSQGSIGGDITVSIEAEGTCPLSLTNVYGGGNMAEIGSNGNNHNITTTIGCGVGSLVELYGGSKMADVYGNVTLTVNSGVIDNVYGGSQGTYETAADINGDVVLNIYGGDIGNVFGGSNINGNIDGTITVNVDWSQSSCEGTKQLENVYGGSNLAQYAPTASKAAEGYYPLVNLINGTVGRTVWRTGHPVFDPANPGSQGQVFGGGKGSVADPQSGKVTGNPKVLMNPSSNENFVVLNAVYGGGELASVDGNTYVVINKGHVGSATKDIDEDNGFVFGGGKGSAINPMLANVKFNSTVTISGGYVHNSVFGGGEIASVGNFTRASAADPTNDVVVGEPISCADGTGTTTVTISGGQVGPTDVTMLADLGYVFGASMGVYTQPKVEYTDPFFNSVEMARQNARFGYADNAVVTISDNAFIVGAVWGGSENGQVLHDCTVNIQGGQIGCGKNKTAPYTSEQWTAAKNAVLSNDVSAIATIAAAMPECDSWDYDGANGHNYLPYDPYADDDGLTNASDPGYDGHTYFGNVFGGGSGYYGYRITEGSNPTRNVWFPFQGRVRGDTYLNITGGHILTSAYGGCEYADVMGKCTVVMSGGTLGVPRTAEQIIAHPVTCYLFGAGKGDQRDTFNDHTNVGEAEVTVNGDAVIYGSVFGGGEDGHVVGDATVNIAGNALIGSTGTSYFDGNIFGGGRGFGGTSVLAGSIGGDAEINISGSCKILGSVFGGGRLASIGVYLVPDDDPLFGKLQDGKGNITVTITGGTIGNYYESTPAAFSTGSAYNVNDLVAYQNKIWRFTSAHPAGAWNASHVVEVTHTIGGNVFGGSMGRLLKLGAQDPSVAANFNPLWPKMAMCRSTEVNISGDSRVYSNVYGGGEMGLVFEDTQVTVEASTQVGHVVGEENYGAVYGGGYGSDILTAHTNDSTNVTPARHAGLVYGNTSVSITGGLVRGNVFGGGEMASVGTYNYKGGTGADKDEITSLKNANSGETMVSVSGGQIGFNSLHNGRVFGAGKGVVGANMDYYTFVDRTNVTISGDGTQVRGCVFGSGDNGHVLHNTNVSVTGGTIGNNNGSPTNGNVFGSGRGADTYLVGSTPTLSPNAGRVYGNTVVSVDGNNTIVKNNVYGGGYLATVDGNTTVTIGNNYDPTVWGDVFGGSALGAIGNTNGTTTLNIYGGTIGSTSSYYYNAGTDTHKGNVFGGGNGDAEGSTFDGATNGTTNGKRAADVRNTVLVNIGQTDDNEVNTTDATITGDVFGGNNVMGTPLGNVTVNINSTKRTAGTNTIADSGYALHAVYGGGNKADYVPTATGAKSQVNVNGCYNTVQYVYGGGNAAAVPEANSLIEGGHVEWSFAGGNGYSATGNHSDPNAANYNPGANVGQYTNSSTTYGSGDATALIYGGTVDHTFAGSNQYGDIKGTTTVTLDNSQSTCDMNLNEVFGGGNMANITGDVNTVIECNPSMENIWIPALYGGCNMANVTGNVTLTVCGGSYLNVYGGSKGTTETPANITGNVTLNMYGGRVGNSTTEGNIFGGSNINGNIGGQITVNVEYQSGTSCIFDLSHANVFGGGNLAQYAGSPIVNIKHGTVLNVFGGGNGNPNDATQNPGKVAGSTVTIGDDNTAHRAVVLGNVFGGGNAARATGNTSILLKQRAKVFGNVYGGGNMGEVEGNTNVTVDGVSGN